jgi:hypothetical protein
MRSSFSRKHRIPYLPLVMLMLVQLACYASCYPELFYSYQVVRYCEDYGVLRFGSEQSCYSNVESSCPNSDYDAAPDACINSVINPAIPENVDCSNFRIVSPRTMFEFAGENQIIRWTSLPEAHNYRVMWGEEGVYRFGNFGYSGSTSRAISISDRFFAGVERFNVRVEARISYTTLCSDSVVVSRYMPPAPTVDCSVFRLTAPLEGLANGVNTFYWDALPSASGYALTVTDAGGTTLASLSTAAGTTNATVDLSSTTTGDGGILTVTVEALVDGSAVCTDTRSIQRAAFVPGAPVSSTPGLVCGDGICVMPDEAACLADCN